MMAEETSHSFRLTRSQRGAEKLIEGGYIYCKHRRVGEITHWLCEQRGYCKAIIHTKGIEIIKRTNEHLHAPDEKAVSCCVVKENIKRKAMDSQDSSHHIVGECLQTVSEGTSAMLPKLDSLKRSIQRQRVRSLAAPVQPVSLEQLALPDMYKRTSKDEQFLLYNSGQETQRILIFSTHQNLEMLQLSRVWLADGTFKTAPLLFTQLYVIHALRGGPDLMKDGHLLPSLFILLPNKSEATYTRMWHNVQMLLDFEKAAINSFEHTWPNCMVKGCFFHLSQNIWRKVQAVGMQGLYSQDQELAIRIRMIPALAYAAPHEVPDMFAEVAAQLPTPQADGLIQYFERTYVGRTLPGGAYQHPLFPIVMWNHHFNTTVGLPRTTNAVEAWHRSFNATVGCHHPNIPTSGLLYQHSSVNKDWWNYDKLNTLQVISRPSGRMPTLVKEP